MEIVNANVELVVPKDSSFDSQLKIAEEAGRISYQSQDKITVDSYKEFINRLIKNKHYSPLEFASVFLSIPKKQFNCLTIVNKYIQNKYSDVDELDDRYSIVTNYRVLVENKWEDDLKYWDKCLSYANRFTVHFTLPIGISREFIRHRSFSFMEESTRFCNYNKLENIKFIYPIAIATQDEPKELKDAFDIVYSNTEATYKALIKSGEKPQTARDVLPLGTKTELYMCGSHEDWCHFFDLRCADNAHPMARFLAKTLQDKFYKTFFETETKISLK